MRMLSGFVATFVLLSAGACTHQRVVSPSYSPQVTAVRPASICPRGELVSVAVANQSPAGMSAGTTYAGPLTFNYIFASDPALVLKRGIQETLRRGGCQLGAPSAANLGLRILRIEARGLECVLLTCDGTAESMVMVTLSDSVGRPLFQQTITSNVNRSCGGAICNEEEVSGMAAEVLSETIVKTINAFAGMIARQVAAPPTAPAAPVFGVPANRS